MPRTDLSSWRRVTLDQVYQVLGTIVLAGMVLIATTRLDILPEDLLYVGDFSGGGDTLRQLLYLAGFAIMVVTAEPLRDPGRLFALPLSMLVLVAWCIASIGWAIEPSIAARRLGLALLVIWIGFRTVNDVGPSRAMKVVLYVLTALLFANLLAVAIFPQAVHHTRGMMLDDSIAGAWRGILPEKNGAGLATAINFLLLLFGLGRFRLLARLSLMALCLVFLAGTQSKTSMGLLAFSAIIGGLFQLYGARMRVLVLPLLVVLLAVATCLLWIYLPPYLDELDSSLNAFTGRIQIWRVMLQFIQDHPLLGAGFGSVWNIGSNSPIYSYTSIDWIRRLISQGHNGYLEMAMQIGLIGAALGTVTFFFIPITKVLASTTICRRMGGLCLALLVFGMLYNFTESSILVPDHFGQVMLILAIASVERLRRPAAERWPGVERALATFRIVRAA
jgi:O-antigen ligase